MRQKKAPTTIEFMARECVANQLRMLNRVVTGMYENEFRPLKLTASQMVILALTEKRDQIRAAELCKWLQIDASTLSRNIALMKKRGWVRVLPGEDVRSHALTITTGGRKLLREILPSWRKAQREAAEILGAKGTATIKAVANRYLPRH